MFSDEKRLTQIYSQDDFFRKQYHTTKTMEYKRQQSVIYRTLHPKQDVEMNLVEIEDALRQINGHLLTTKEMQYIYHVSV